MAVKQQLQNIKKKLPPSVSLVAVSKTKPEAAILEAYEAGQRIFGENKIQEMALKWEHLPKDIQWHMIGHVQTNKIKYMASFVSLVHGVDSMKLLQAIDKEAKKNQRTIPCLFQVHIAGEDTKFGMDDTELLDIIDAVEYKKLKNIKAVGLMGMASNTENKDQIRDEFRYLKSLFEHLKAREPNFEILSMGMSGDFGIAIEEGSTMVRLGSCIFGERN